MDQEQGPKWYCLRSQPKHEHIAAAHLRLMPDVDVFCPRLRIQKSTRRGLVWFVEPLFPCYVFARFAREQRTQVRYAHGVSGLVHFGEKDAEVQESSVLELREFMGEGELVTAALSLAPGDEVEIVEGPLRGGSGIITAVLPARERVKVLLEFLGGSREIEVSLTSVFRQARLRQEDLR